MPEGRFPQTNKPASALTNLFLPHSIVPSDGRTLKYYTRPCLMFLAFHPRLHIEPLILCCSMVIFTG